jgi:hypothetical protein
MKVSWTFITKPARATTHADPPSEKSMACEGTAALTQMWKMEKGTFF